MTLPSLNRLVLAALVWVAASFLIHELCSLDVWWQLVIGNDILQHLHVPRANIYSAAALNQPYHDSHWLFQLVLAGFHRLAGLNGAILFMTLSWGLTLFLLYREIRCTTKTAVAALLTFLAMGASAERFLPRPELITFLMVVLFYSRLRQGKFETPAQISLLVLLQVIWVNCHGLSVIGPFIVGCYWLVHGVAALRRRRNQVKPLSVLLVLVGAASMASPYGIEALKYSFLLFQEVGQEAPAHMRAVTELSSTFGAAAMSGSAFWFFAALLFLFASSSSVAFRRIDVGRLLIVVGLLLAAVTGRRNVVLFALVAAPFVGENLSVLGSRIKIGPTARRGLKVALVAILLLWSVYPLSGRYYLDMEIPARFGFGVTPDFFPHGLRGFLERNDIPGQVYNTNRLGGFYLYNFYPDRLPLQDGRWEVYGDEFFRKRDQALKSYADWSEWIVQYGVETALLHHTAPESRMLVPALYRDPEWSLVYYDFAASMFVRNRVRGSAAPILFSESSRVPNADVRPESRFILSAFYRNLGLDRLLLENLAMTLPFGRETANILLEMAKIHLKRQELGEAEARYIQLLGIDDHHRDALSDLSFIKYQQRRYEQALDYSARAMIADPTNVDLRFNHAMILEALGRDTEAFEILTEILNSRPDYWKARELLKRVSPGGS